MAESAGNALPVVTSDGERLLAVVRSLVAESRGVAAAQVGLGLDSRLDRDLGLDSLARAELALRLEREFDARLPEALVAEAGSPRDLLAALARRGARAAAGAGAGAGATAAAVADLGPIEMAPETCETLVEVLDWHLRVHPDRRHLTLIGDGESELAMSYADLARGAGAVAAGLRKRGIGHGQAVALMLPTSTDFFFAFFGILLAGAIPVPVYPPVRREQIEDHLRRQAATLENCRAALLVTVDAARPLAALLRGLVPELRDVVTVAGLGAEILAEPVPVSAADVAFLQYTSGSTGNPKGVVLTHANLLTNLRAIGRVVDPRPGEVFVSWLPLYHDMGLIGAWFGSLLFSLHLVVMPPTAFLARPSRWLQALSRWRGAITAAPNFAYELCASKVDERDVEGVDLSSLRWAFNGAEAIDPDTLDRFIDRFSRHGFRAEALAPVYGLAESTVGLAFPPPGRGPLVDRVSRSALLRDGRAARAEPDEPNPARFVACGRALPGHEIRVADASGRELPERTEGRVEFRGPSATSGYYRNSDATRNLFRNGWIDTGDIGYVAEAELYITSRAKDLIKRGGHTVHPHELEDAVGDLPGVRKGCVAVIGVPDRRAGTERVVVIAEVRDAGAMDDAAFRAAVNSLADSIIGGPADEVVRVPARTVPKTSSGKIRRAAMRELYVNGLRERKPVWRQLARMAISAGVGRVRRLVRTGVERAWSAYAWSLAVLLALLATASALIVPRFAWRTACTRALARALVALSGLPVSVEGAARARTAEPMIVVANHASYVDAILLLSLLPTHVVFIAKREFQGTALGWLLGRSARIRFVERFDPRRALEDARGMVALAQSGLSLVIFPEGTFRRAPGVLPFQMGAFVAAAQSSTRVLPVALRGARDVLREGSWLPRRRRVAVVFGEPLGAPSADYAGALHLRDRARAAIVAACAEPAL